MPGYFCDTSALAKRYVAETGSSWLSATIDPKAGNYVFIARITYVEVFSAISRKERSAHISTTDAVTAKKQFQTDYSDEFFSVEITETLILNAAGFADKYSLRGYDAVQLAAALETENERISLGLPSLTLLSADTDLNTAAVNEGLAVENPNDH
jgi:uncharacterized protein